MSVTRLAEAAPPVSGIIDNEDEVTPVVLAALAKVKDPRTKQILEALTRHVHAFAKEVRLTEREWEIGVDFLNRIGKQTTDTHNEGILFSDAVGLSTLVCLMNNGQNGATETAAALLGPFWRMNSPRTENGGSIVRSETPGPALFANCRILDDKKQPISGVEVDIWQSSPAGVYENQDESQADMNLRGKFVTDKDGRFSFRSVKPAGYPVPMDGPVGDMIRLRNRHHYRPAHLHFLCFKPGFKTLITQVFVDDDEHLESDVVFGVTRALVGDYVRHDKGTPPAPDISAPWYTLEYTFYMEPGEAQLPKPPIA
jgi:protocatechuate 3,4-dioxygenase beta subunit